jgi:GNAT superfamily N-acetyltransferase
MTNEPKIAGAEIRVLTPGDVNQFWPLRLRALKEEPESFGKAYKEATSTPLEQVAQQLECSDDSFVFGAFLPHLVGIVGYVREKGLKRRHKGMVWGMYVAREARGRGLGAALMQNLISRARTVPDLERLVLSVGTTNEAARQLYLSLGFVSYGIEGGALKLEDKYLDEDLMSLTLGGF